MTGDEIWEQRADFNFQNQMIPTTNELQLLKRVQATHRRGSLFACLPDSKRPNFPKLTMRELWAEVEKQKSNKKEI